jgi:hypothetical protein
VVCGSHLLGLQFYADSFETRPHGEMMGGFFPGRCLLGLDSARQGVGRLSIGEGSGMWQGLVLFDALSSAFFKKKKKMEGRNSQGDFSLGTHNLVAVPCWDFPGC